MRRDSSREGLAAGETTGEELVVSILLSLHATLSAHLLTLHLITDLLWQRYQWHVSKPPANPSARVAEFTSLPTTARPPRTPERERERESAAQDTFVT